jgi:hypothetical protein
MNYTQYIIPLCIIIYAIFEYQRREQQHRERMELLKRDVVPATNRRTPTIATIIYTASVACILLLAIIAYFILIIHLHLKSFGLILLPALFIVILILLLLILKRDITTYKTINKL